MSPQYYLAHAWMGNAYTLAGNFDEALECYARAREADANNQVCRFAGGNDAGYGGPERPEAGGYFL